MFDRLRPYYNESLEWKKQAPSSPSKKRGIGVALGGYHVSMAADTSEVWLGLNPDNTVTDYNCWQELGQGTDTGSLAFTQKALEPLHLRADQIRLVKDDTGIAPKHGASAGSRSAYVSGNAHIVAGNMMLDAMRKEDGTYRTYDEMIAEGKPVLFKGVWTEANTRVANDPNSGVGDPMLDHNFILSVSRVEVDTETGKVDVIAAHSVADVGVINNRSGLEGQAYGGMEHAIGFALREDYSDFDKKYETMYGCGTTQCDQMPDDCEFEFIETPRKYGPFGSGGASECFQSSPHVCILNAVADAIDCRIYELPADPQKIKAALAAKAAGKDLKPEKYYLGSDLFETLEEIKASPVEVRQAALGTH
jgi:aldehyde oxidoreductase